MEWYEIEQGNNSVRGYGVNPLDLVVNGCFFDSSNSTSSKTSSVKKVEVLPKPGCMNDTEVMF
jgi:hypothetical protein